MNNKKIISFLIAGTLCFSGLILGNCLANQSKYTGVHALAHSDHDEVSFSEWTSTTSLPSSGSYYLANDVTLSSTWQPSTGTRLCLNGHAIKKNSSSDDFVGIKLPNSNSSGYDLYIYDCDDTTHKYSIDEETGLAVVDDSLTEDYQTFTGGYITGFTGGAIHLTGGPSTSKPNVLYFYGGTIIGNSSTGNGAGIRYDYKSGRAGRIVMRNSSIIGNKANGQGGGIYHQASNSQFYMMGNTVIKQNISGIAPAGVFEESHTEISGNVYIYDNHLTDGTPSDLDVIHNWGQDDRLIINGTLDESSKIGLRNIRRQTLFNYYSHNSVDPNLIFTSNQNNFLLKKGSEDAEDNVVANAVSASAYQGTYDGEEHTIGTVTLSDATISHTIKYGTSEDSCNLDSAPTFTDVGTNTVYYEVKAGNNIYKGSATVSIGKANSSITAAPTAKENLKYTGESQTLINAGTATGGTLKYKVDSGTYSEEVPSMTKVGTYTVYYKVFGDSNHNDSDEASIKVTISKQSAAVLSEEQKPTAKSGLVYSGSAQALLNPPANDELPSSYTKIQYSIKEGNSWSSWSDAIPTGTNVGSYDVRFKVVADGNRDDIEPEVIEGIVISKQSAAVLSEDQKPTAKSDLVFSGSAQTLLNPPANDELPSSYIKIQYSIKEGTEWSEWSDSIPTGTDVGSYDVRFKVVADGNREDIEPEVIEGIVIAKQSAATLTAEQKPTAKVDLKYTGESQTLLNPPANDELPSSYIKIQYSIKEGTEWSEWSDSIPTGTDVGSYDVRFKVVADGNREDIEPEVIEGIVIAKQSAAVLSEDQKPTAKTDLVYSGSAQALLNPPVNNVLPSSYIKIQYSIKEGTEWSEWSDSIPTRTDSGSYDVRFKVIADGHREDIEPEVIEGIVIANSVPTYVSEPTAVSGLHYTGVAQDLVVAGSSNDGVVKYSFSENEGYSETIPQKTDAGSYTVYYKIFGDNNHDDSAVKSLVITISGNDKTELVSTIAEADVLYNSIKDSHPQVAETLKTVIDSAKDIDGNDNVTVDQINNALDVLEEAIEKAKVDSRDVLVDETSGVTIETEDGTGIPLDIKLKVEVKTDVKAEEGSEEYNKIQEKIGNRQNIDHVYEIKLIKTEGGVETEIQPSDIKEGMKLIINIELPEDLQGKDFRILHIHNNGEMEYVSEFSIDNNVVEFEVSSLSELAFVTQVPQTGLPGWVTALIIIGGLLVLACGAYFLLFFVFNKWINKNNKATRVLPFALGKKEDKKRVMMLSFKVEYRTEAEIYKTKEEALR